MKGKINSKGFECFFLKLFKRNYFFFYQRRKGFLITDFNEYYMKISNTSLKLRISIEPYIMYRENV